MDLDEYQKLARKTAIYPSKGRNYVYPLLGLAGETGEVCEKFKKLIRDSNGVITKEFKEMIKLELGDILWYVANLGAELNLKLADIARSNVEKLASRKKRGKLKGSGDLR